MLPQENLNFLNVRNAGLWHSGRLFAIKKNIITNAVTAKFGGIFW